MIGAGGVGGFLGCVLAQGGHEVSFLARGEHLDAIRAKGLRLRSRQFGELTASAQASNNVADLPPADLVLVAVKMYDFAEARQAAKKALAPGGVAATIQNGLDAPAELAKVVPSAQVLIGTASIEATILEPGVIGHLIPVHQMTLSEFDGPPTERLQQVVGTLAAAGLTVTVAADGQRALWDKAATLIPFATLTSAADAGIGPILNLAESAALMQQLVEETVAVALKSGYDPRPSIAAMSAAIQQVAQAIPDFTSSMNRDFRRGNRTELEWLTGKLVRLGAEVGVPTPRHEALYALLKLKEERAA